MIRQIDNTRRVEQGDASERVGKKKPVSERTRRVERTNGLRNSYLLVVKVDNDGLNESTAKEK